MNVASTPFHLQLARELRQNQHITRDKATWRKRERLRHDASKAPPARSMLRSERLVTPAVHRLSVGRAFARTPALRPNSVGLSGGPKVLTSGGVSPGTPVRARRFASPPDTERSVAAFDAFHQSLRIPNQTAGTVYAARASRSQKTDLMLAWAPVVLVPEVGPRLCSEPWTRGPRHTLWN